MSHYVVTGGAGFIGSAIVRALLRDGASKVVVIDNLASGHERNLEEVRSRIDFQRASELLDEAQHNVDIRCLDADQTAHFLHRCQQRIDLQRATAFKVLQHRSAMRADAGRSIDALFDIDAE